VPEDRTHVFQKYRVRLHPEEMGLRTDYKTIRDRMLLALRAEGVEAVLWHTTPLPAYPLFQQRTGFGGAFPWTVPPASRDVTYDSAAYPEATRLLDCSILIGSERNPLCGQDEDLMDHYLAAFHKVYAELEELLADPTLTRPDAPAMAGTR
jgi:hypothetical protein